MHRGGFAFDWARRLAKALEPSDFPRLERWLRDYVTNWGQCDSLCCGALGMLIDNYPELAAERASWVDSENRWIRRAAAVSLIVAVKNGLLLDEVFETANSLLEDSDDMVQKGYGWMLKDASLKFPSEVFSFVLKKRKTMPRTALRYAIERYSKEERKEAMKKV
jgi:3-methyladenine DNA glycosylase AlkD